MSKFLLDQNLCYKLQIDLTSVCFNFVRKKIENLGFKNDQFKTISGDFFGKYMNIFHKTEIQTVILRCLISKNLNWVISYNKIMIKIFFFNAWKCIISELVCQSEFGHLREKPAPVFSKWIFFQNSLELSWNT